MNCQSDSISPDHRTQIGDVLSDGSSKYKIEKFLGHGRYGDVVQCIKSHSKEKIALKLMRKIWNLHGEHEVAVLEALRVLDRDHNNLVIFTNHFTHKNQHCLAFEKLDISLFDLMKKRGFVPLCLSEISVITQQMLVALNALKIIHIIHTDIKPDNIMLVNHEKQPFKVKLIDFGLAKIGSTITQGAEVQSIGYRAPEIILGVPSNEAIDMWSLGCVIGFLYLGRHLHPIHCVYEDIQVITQMLGQPDDHMLNSGFYTGKYFTKEQGVPFAPWRLHTQQEYKEATGSVISIYGSSSNMFNSLEEITVTRKVEKDATEYEDTKAFLSLLRCMLNLDPQKRITPSEALGHCFISMKHFPSDIKDKSVE